MLERVAQGVFLLRGWADFASISSSVYFLVSGDTAIAIDCGNASAQTARDLKAAVKELGCKLKAVYCTHGHADHVGGVKAIPREVPVFLAKEDFCLITEAERKRFTPLEGNAVKFGGVALEIIETPGHTPGSVCFWDAKNKILFSGDTLFAGGAFGRTDFPGGNEKEMAASLALIKKLGWRLLCPGHDEVERVERKH